MTKNKVHVKIGGASYTIVTEDEAEYVTDLKRKLKSDDRQVIVTTIQKLQILINKRLQEGTSEYQKIKNLKIAFVVDECHRAVTPKTKRELERFFGRSLWFGFTGTPRFVENPYPQMGDLPRTTEELYGECLHRYTIQNAIHDKAVLGFQVEHNGSKMIIDKFQGGPVGLTTIATALGEDPGTLEEVYEPFLIKEGFIKRTPRGREVTDLAYTHLGRSRVGEQGSLFD